MSKVRTSVILHEQKVTLYSSLAGLDFNAILLKPKEMTAGSKLPLIVMPHGLFFSTPYDNVKII